MCLRNIDHPCPHSVRKIMSPLLCMLLFSLLSAVVFLPLALCFLVYGLSPPILFHVCSSRFDMVLVFLISLVRNLVRYILLFVLALVRTLCDISCSYYRGCCG